MFGVGGRRLCYQKHDSVENMYKHTLSNYPFWKLIPCWLFLKKNCLMLVFIQNRKSFYLQKKEIFHISFYYYIFERGSEQSEKRKSHLPYRNLGSFQFIFLRKVLNSFVGERRANHRCFNGKTKGVKVIFHNFPPLFIVQTHHTHIV